MLRAIHVASALPFPLPHAMFIQFPDFEKLLALETVEQDPSEALFKILFDARNNLFKQVRLGRSQTALALLFVKIRRQDLIDGMGRRERDEGEILGDILPVIDKDRFHVVRDDDTDRGARVE